MVDPNHKCIEFISFSITKLTQAKTVSIKNFENLYKEVFNLYKIKRCNRGGSLVENINDDNYNFYSGNISPKFNGHYFLTYDSLFHKKPKLIKNKPTNTKTYNLRKKKVKHKRSP